MNELLLRVIDNMRIQSKSQFANLRELLNTHSELMPQVIENLDELVDKFDNQKTLNDILYDCCEDVFGVTYDEIHEKTRRRVIVDSRGMFISFLSFADHKITWQSMGKIFDLDHATAIHCARKFCELYAIDGEYRFNADQFFDTLEKYGYNCKETKRLLQYGQPYFTLKGSITRRENKQTGELVERTTNKIERLSFHCAIT